jgi:hypothetical protein
MKESIIADILLSQGFCSLHVLVLVLMAGLLQIHEKLCELLRKVPKVLIVTVIVLDTDHISGTIRHQGPLDAQDKCTAIISYYRK